MRDLCNLIWAILLFLSEVKTHYACPFGPSAPPRRYEEKRGKRCKKCSQIFRAYLSMKLCLYSCDFYNMNEKLLFSMPQPQRNMRQKRSLKLTILSLLWARTLISITRYLYLKIEQFYKNRIFVFWSPFDYWQASRRLALWSILYKCYCCYGCANGCLW